MEINRYIDHTLLKPDATLKQIENLCQEALQYSFFSVCINPSYVATCEKILKNSNVAVCTVIGFPLGATTSAAKAYEAARAIKDGADELDMVINIGALKSQKYLLVEEDIREVVKAAEGKIVKVIIETSLLNEEEKITACKLSTNAGANFVKTSTGFNGGGATIEDIILMKSNISTEMWVKASGGIRDLKSAQDLIASGASRLGTSSGITILKGLESHSNY